MCSGSGLLPQESMPPTPICATSMQKSVSACGSSSPACLTRCLILSSGPSKSSRLYRWHCMPRPPPGTCGGHAAINNPTSELPEPLAKAIHLVSNLLPFSCGRMYLKDCSKMRPCHSPTRAEDFLSMYASCGPNPSQVTSSKPSTNWPRKPTRGGAGRSLTWMTQDAAPAEEEATTELCVGDTARYLPEPSKACNVIVSPLMTCPSPASRESFQRGVSAGDPVASTRPPSPVPGARP
mmetsp:Transcript_70500/g.204328  ORF Transcript_70500/g.204328 Transcript_70500/m.204328 type:complete len:237 (-) Transcript_70500:516-1226(-)